MNKGTIWTMIGLSLFFLCLNNGITAVIMMWGMWFVYYFKSAKGDEIRQNKTEYYIKRKQEYLMGEGFNPYYVKELYNHNFKADIEKYYKHWEEEGLIDDLREVGWDARTEQNAFSAGVFH